MNHQKVYNQLIAKAKFENRIRDSYYVRRKLAKTGIIYESHHIIPKCIGGTNDASNLVLLTPKEHYLAHKLLMYIYPDNRKIMFAWHRMSHNKNVVVSSRDYNHIKSLLSSIPVSIETCERISKGMIGKNKGKVSPFKGVPRSEKTKEILRLSQRGKIRSEESKEHMRKPRSEEGKLNMKQPKSESHKEAMRLAHKKRKEGKF